MRGIARPDVICMIPDGTDEQTINRARLCSKCKYNLYGLVREGTCPECGHPYKRQKADAKDKNPRRQLAQLRRVKERRLRAVRWLPAWWFVAGSAIVACIVFGARPGWWMLAVIFTLFTAAKHLVTVGAHDDTRLKIEAIDQSISRSSS